MDLLQVGILFPHREIRFHIDLSYTVQSDHIELADRLVVLRRIACRHDDPPPGHLLITEGLVLQELEHGGGQRLGYAVDLIDKEDSLLHACLLHLLIHGRNDLAHGIFCHRISTAAIFLFPDKGQSHGTLSRVVGNSISYKADLHLLRDLLHDLGLTDTRRPHEQHRPLPDGRDPVISQVILHKICFNGILYLLFCSLNIQMFSPFVFLRSKLTGILPSSCRTPDTSHLPPDISFSLRISRMAQAGTSTSL